MINTPDLTQKAPRSVHTQLGNLVTLPRMLDKCRATIAGNNGEYHFNCPLDQRLLSFLQIDAEAFKAEVEKGKDDSEMLNWVQENSPRALDFIEATTWSKAQRERVPEGNESRTFMNDLIAEAGGANREDIQTWFDYLDFDDHMTFGGTA